MIKRKEVNKKFVPILYVYLYRNLLNCHGCKSISFDETRHNFRKTIFKVPAIVFRRIVDDLEECGFVKIINRQSVLILRDGKTIKQLSRLNEYAFPISPNN